MPAELEQQPAIYCAERELAALRARPSARHMVEQPGEFGAGKIRIEQQAGARRHFGFMASGAQLLARGRRAPVLPDDRGRHRLARTAIPQHRGFTLIGDAHCGDIARRCTSGAQGFRHGRELRLPDFRGVVFDPAWPREVLCELALRQRGYPSFRIEQQRAGARGALVECENVFRGAHGGRPRFVSRTGRAASGPRRGRWRRGRACCRSRHRRRSEVALDP